MGKLCALGLGRLRAVTDGCLTPEFTGGRLLPVRLNDGLCSTVETEKRRMKVLWGYPGWGWQMFGLIGKENKWFFGLSRKEFLPKETEQQRRNRLEEVLSIHKAFTDAAERHNVKVSSGVLDAEKCAAGSPSAAP